MKKTLSLIIALMLCISSAVYADDSDKVVTLGHDLTESERQQMLDLFNVQGDVKIIEVTNEEEWEYFGDFLDESLIGYNAISSVYVEKLPEGEGLSVETYNIFYVTEDMYKNALITAGVEDARIIVASPKKASGTAALTGILKAFENATGDDITEEEKRTASEEIAKTAKLGEIIGKDKAQELIRNVKIYIINNNIKDKDSIKKVIEKTSKDLSIELSDEQIEEIISLMQKISKLDLDIDEIKEQLKDIQGKIDEIINQNIEVKSLLQRIIDAIISFLKRIFG
jgi:uncharacterized protein YpuA (DUF1002 family)